MVESCECPVSSADVTTLSRKVFQQPGLPSVFGPRKVTEMVT